jgi:hypothetical protein
VIALTGEKLERGAKQLLFGALALTHTRMLVANILVSTVGTARYCPAEVE